MAINTAFYHSMKVVTEGNTLTSRQPYLAHDLAGFAPEAQVSSYLKLLPMLAGIGSPGTLQEVRLFS